jgi:hypothetical protein
MVESKSVRDPIPDQFATIEEAAEFWDTHDLADYWDLTEEVDFEVNLRRRRYPVALDPELAEKLAKEARQRGLSTETLVNLWLNEKLQQVTAWNLKEHIG